MSSSGAASGGPDDESADAVEMLLSLRASVYPCDECGEVDAPGHIPPLSEEEGRLLTACEACGGWFHHMCGYDLPTRNYLRLLRAGAGASLPVQRVICKACCVEWTQDLYNLNQADKVCTRRFKEALRRTGVHAMSALSRTRGLTSGGCLPAFEATFSSCTADIAISTRDRYVMLLIGGQGTGKSKLLDTMSCSLWPDSPRYPPTPEGWRSVTEAVPALLRERLQLRIPEPLLLPPELSPGEPAFGPDGKLLGLHEMLELHGQRTKLLADYAVDRVTVQSKQLVPGMLPFARENQPMSSTTMASIMALKDLRHTVMLFTMTQPMLLEVVGQLRATLAKEFLLGEYEKGFLKAVFGTTDPRDLPTTGAELAAAVLPCILDTIGELGTPITISLPGKVPLHERLFLVHLASQVSGQTLQRPPWMWLVWLMVRGVPSGLLPGNDALVDTAGRDSRPIHQVIRSWTLRLKNSCILVVHKDLASYRPHPLTDMEEEGLLSQVASGALPLMVVFSDHNHYGIDMFLDPSWAAIKEAEGTREKECRAQLLARLRALNPDSGQQMAKNVPIMTVRALEFEGVMEAWGSSRLAGYSQQQQQTLLLRTGAARLYCGMMRTFKFDTVQAVTLIANRTGKLEEMMHVLLGNEHPNLPTNRPGGLGQFDAASVVQNEPVCRQALSELKPKMKNFVPTFPDLMMYLPEESKTRFMQLMEELWASDGQPEAAVKVRRAVYITAAGAASSLPSLDQLLGGVEALLHERPNKRAQGAQHLVSLVGWVQGLTFAHLEPLLEPCRNFVVAGLQRTMDQVPAFQQVPELQRLRMLWLQYVAPLVMDNEVDSACKRKLLKDVQSDLKAFLVEQVCKLLNDVKLQQQREEDGGSLAALLDRDVIRKVWPCISVADSNSGGGSSSGPSPLLSKVVQNLHKHVVHGPLTVLARGSSGALGLNLVRRLTADLQMLRSPGNLKTLQEHVADLNEPAEYIVKSLETQLNTGAANLEKLIVLMHTHKALLSKYSRYNIIMFDCCSDRAEYNSFSKPQSNDRVIEMTPAMARPRPWVASPLELPVLDAPDMQVDMDHLAQQLRDFVFGVQGQIVLPDGEEVQLSLADPEQQLQVVKDLLLRQLIHAAVDEQHASEDHQWFTQAASVSANQVLTTGSHLSSPRHMLAMLALLLGCDMRVRVPLEEPSGQPPAKRSRSNVGCSGGPRTCRYHYLLMSPPAKRGSTQEAGIAAAAGGPAAGAGAMPQQKKGMVLQLSLRKAGGLWLFDVVSSTMVSSAKRANQRKTAALEQDDDEYKACALCGRGSEEEALLCCDGRCCAVVLHASHLPPEQQKAALRQPTWLCSTCTLRGRNLHNPMHLKPPRAT